MASNMSEWCGRGRSSNVVVEQRSLGGISLMDELEREAKQRLLAIWEEKRQGRTVPARSDFDVLRDLRPFLGYIILAESIDDGRSWRFRLFGTEIAEAINEERQGHYLHQLPSDESRRLRFMLASVAQFRQPAVFKDVRIGSRFSAICDAVLLPLSEDGDEVNMILMLLAPLSRQRASPSPETG